MGMTNKEKFKEVLDLEIDDSSDCGFFNCTGKECKDCPVKDTKDWWNSPYKRAIDESKIDCSKGCLNCVNKGYCDYEQR